MNKYVVQNKKTLMGYMISQINKKRELGHERTSETYASTLCSFMRFRNDEDVKLCDIDADLIQLYEAYLINTCHLTKNSSSFYMRILRAVYNSAVEGGLVKQRMPFKHVYTGVEKTAKRALSITMMKRIKDFDLSSSPSMDFARDVFLFSFYTRGMSFIDIAYLKKSDLQGDRLVYRRRKTGQLLYIKWEKCMQKIVNKYRCGECEYLFPIISSCKKNKRLQYRTAMANVNEKLKMLGVVLQLPMPLTMYVARHSWASVAKSRNVPLSVISEAMGHESENTTQIYLASFETTVVDNANRKIMKLLQ